MDATNHWFIAEYPYIESLATGCISGIFMGRLLFIFLKFDNRYQNFLARSKDT